jgi:hypothetical protein
MRLVEKTTTEDLLSRFLFQDFAEQPPELIAG